MPLPKLTPADFTNQPGDPDFTAAVSQLQRFAPNQPEYRPLSDVVDAAGHQYVDLVMEGGGMLGIALVGYVYGLELAGIRFLRLGGTSAGSINALLMAAATRGPAGEVTPWLVERIANKNFYDFVDGDSDARDFIDTMLHRGAPKRGFLSGIRNAVDTGMLLEKGVQVIDNFRDNLGLNPGRKFRQWIRDLLTENNCTTADALWQKRDRELRDLTLRTDQPAGEPVGPAIEDLRTGKPGASTTHKVEQREYLAIVATDLSTQTKVIFPRMAGLYWDQPEQVGPHLFVRASMSVPLFFEPFTVQDPPGCDGPQPNPKDPADYTPAGLERLSAANPHLAPWQQISYLGPIPHTVRFCDGGVMSNFPIDLFHDQNHVPTAPTFGIKLGSDRVDVQNTSSLPSFLGAIFDAARTEYDFDFISKNPDYRQLVYCLNVDGFNWLDFAMTPEDQKKLFAAGVKGACAFLQGKDSVPAFNWPAYKEIRAEKAHLRQAMASNALVRDPAKDPDPFQ